MRNCQLMTVILLVSKLQTNYRRMHKQAQNKLLLLHRRINILSLHEFITFHRQKENQ